MRIEYETDKKILKVKLFGELDHHSSEETRNKIDLMLRCGIYDSLILDFRGLDFMDSSGIAFVMGRRNLLKSIGGGVTVISNKPKITGILRLAGMEKYVRIKEEKGVGENEYNK